MNDEARKDLNKAFECMARITTLAEEALPENVDAVLAIRELAQVTCFVGTAIVEQIAADQQDK